MDSYQTIVNSPKTEITIQKSRFIAEAIHVSDEPAVLAFRNTVAAANHAARHIAYAFLLCDGTARCSDAGEPPRTAGLPILQAIRQSGCADLAVTVTRYFGGILLGTGGLVRAYGDAAGKALALAEMVRMTSCTDIRVVIKYELYDSVRSAALRDGACEKDVQFGENVCLIYTFPSGTEGPFMETLRDLCRGKQNVGVSAQYFAAFRPGCGDRKKE